MRLQRVQPRTPSAENKVRVDRATATWLYPSIAFLELTTPLRSEGRENLPSGPGLVLSNHASLFDAYFTILSAKRTIHFLASHAAFMDPFFGRVLYTFGSVPKKKFVADVNAIRQLKAWADVGGLVGSYPEGERSWDGQLLPLSPGIESLIRLLKLPVIPVRVLNADRVMPRWAERRRSGQVKVEFGQPRTFERKADSTMVRTWLAEKLDIDQSDERNHFPVKSRGKLAMGLPNPLFRCPHCFAWDSLDAHDDEVRCRECRSIWRVTVQNTMQASGGPARSLTIIEARALIRARNHSDGHITDERRFESAGIVAQSEPMNLLDVSGDVPVPLGERKMILTASGLRFVDREDRVTLELPLRDVVNSNVELRRRLTFRLKDSTTYEADLPVESPLKWAELVERWRMAAGAATET